MHPWHKRDMVTWLRECAAQIAKYADDLERRKPERLTWSVGWLANGNGLVRSLDERPLSRDEVVNLVAGGIWALFEGERPGDDPSCSRTFDAIMAEVMTAAGRRCHQYGKGSR